MHQGNGQVILPLKRQTPRQHLVEKHAHRVNICSAIEFFALCLFGRKVVDRAKHLAMACILLSFRMLLPLRNAKIQKNRAILGQQKHIGRFQILMQNSFTVQIVKRFAQLQSNGNTLFQFQGSLIDAPLE